MKARSIVKCVLLVCFCSLDFCVHAAQSYSFVSKDERFREPKGVAVDAQGNIYVVDAFGVHKFFDSSGKFLASWGPYGSADGQLIHPVDVAVDGRGNVYVVDANRVNKFDSTGKFLTRWGSYGSADGQFRGPDGIAVDSGGNVFVVEGNRIQKFDSSGKFLTKWGRRGLSGEGCFGYFGVDNGGPRGLAVNSRGHVFVADTYNHRIQMFDSTGKFLTEWGSEGPGDGQFNEPEGIAVDSAGNVYVADRKNDRIQKFKPARADTVEIAPRQVRPEPEKDTTKAGKRTLTIDDVLLLNQLGIEEKTILEKIQTAGKRFTAEEVEKLRQAGLSKEFIEKIPRLDKAKGKKLTVDDILLLHELGFSEEVIRKKIEDSGTTLSAKEIEQLKKAGLSEAFVAKLKP